MLVQTNKIRVKIMDVNIMNDVLLLEDDLSLIQGLSFALKREGFQIKTARTLAEAEQLWTEYIFDLLILDVSLPDGTGFELCQKVRQSSKVPIIFLTASDEEMNMIMGLDMGGDDYITKPFKLAIFMSRVRALIRRSQDFSGQNAVLISNNITVRLLEGQAYHYDEPIDLTAAEYKLLCYFMKHPNMVLSKEQILNALWDVEGDYIDSRSLTVYIRRLRLKIEDTPSKPSKILTVRGMGYKWQV